ncbi:MAG: zinc ribbon domain-containing protein, partial [Promethearchaeota archaeon]
KCGNCGAPASPEASTCGSCGATLEMIEEYLVEEYIQESIDSVTSKHDRIKLKDLDKILRRTLPRPAAYNLRRSLQAMIQSDEIEGHIEGSIFVRTKKRKIPAPSKKDIQKVKGSLRNLLRGTDTLDVRLLERETGVDRRILRRTLIILLGEGIVQGTLSGDEFILEKKQDINDFERKLVDELSTWSG